MVCVCLGCVLGYGVGLLGCGVGLLCWVVCVCVGRGNSVVKVLDC